MAGAQTQNLQYDLNINTQIIHNFAHLLCSNVDRSCFGHLLCDLSQDRSWMDTSFELIYPGIRSHSGCPQQDLFFLIVCFTSYFVFSIAVLPHSPGVVYYHLLLRRETRIPRVAPFSFRIGIWDLFVHRGQKSYTPTTFGKLWTTPGVRCMKHASS